MQHSLRFFSLVVAAGILTAGSAHADQAPIRHLVYNFQVTFTTQSTVHSSGFGADDPDGRSTGDSPSGLTDYRMGSYDQGTIAADILQVQPDSGLVVRMTEQARGKHSSAATVCVVYGTGSTVCDQSHGELTEEEMALLRLLGRGFINPNEIDAHKHWQYSSSAAQASERSDYTITKTAANILDVAYQRQLTVGGARPFTSTTEGTFAYNQLLNMPTVINEDTITHRTAGLETGEYARIEHRISLALSSDSMQAPQGH